MLPSLQTTARGVKWRIMTALLLNQVAFDSADAFRDFKNLGPWGTACAKKDAIAAPGPMSPILTMNALGAARIRLDPRHGVGLRGDAGSHIELKHKLFG